MALVVGIDPSAKKIAVVACETVTGTYAVETGLLYRKGTTKQTPESLGVAIGFMQDFLARIAHMGTAGHCYGYVEPPLVGRGGVQTAIKLGYVGGIIRGCLAEAGFQVYDASLSTWRAGGLGVKSGKGRTTAQVKKETAQAIQQKDPKLYGLVRHDGDLIDAAGIALYGVDTVRKGRVLAEASRSSQGSVQGRGSDPVLRTARVRPGVRRR